MLKGLALTMDELDAAFQTAMSSQSKHNNPQISECFRYKCPHCKIQVWGAPGLMLNCNMCDETLKQL